MVLAGPEITILFKGIGLGHANANNLASIVDSINLEAKRQDEVNSRLMAD